MVEGHQVQRVAHYHRKILLGKCFKATSPNGRFAEGARAINNRPLQRVEAVGKNLFYFWGRKDEPATVMHVHFGMSGQFKTSSLPGPEPTPNTRLQIVSQENDLMGHVSAMTLNHGPVALWDAKREQLGEDPLREDANKGKVWAAMRKSAKSIGRLLMDQNVIAGLGNIYRAEVLFKAGVHPERPGRELAEHEFDTIWQISSDLLRRGFETGSILTVDAEEQLPPPWTRRYVYNHSHCGRCGGKITSWDMAGRTCYACFVCQPEQGGGREATASRPRETAGRVDPRGSGFSGCDSRRKDKKRAAKVEPKSALSAALEKINAGESRAVEHVALMDELSSAAAGLSKRRVADLRQLAARLGLETGGRKAELVARVAARWVELGAPLEPPKGLEVNEEGKIPFKRAKKRKIGMSGGKDFASLRKNKPEERGNRRHPVE